MMGWLDPGGLPLATDVLSGEGADDGLYISIIERIRNGLQTTGLLFVGDCKMSALETRAYLAEPPGPVLVAVALNRGDG